MEGNGNSSVYYRSVSRITNSRPHCYALEETAMDVQEISVSMGEYGKHGLLIM